MERGKSAGILAAEGSLVDAHEDPGTDAYGGHEGVAGILIAHYHAVRAESLQRMRTRDQLIYYFFVGTGLCWYFYLQMPQANGVALLAVPMLASVIAASYFQHDANIRVLGDWARQAHTANLREYCEYIGYGAGRVGPRELRHWDVYPKERDGLRIWASRSRYLTLAAVLSPVAGVSLVTAWPLLRAWFAQENPLMFALVCGVFGVLVLLCLMPLVYVLRLEMGRR